ncbi:MAG: AgmX/PglI C-terminal domain-containing protein [Deltaproteobacteria bacterium]|nr:AgmX/PglI C-terminal domain-containing protein [Deltaproteobacteria bacterium]
MDDFLNNEHNLDLIEDKLEGRGSVFETAYAAGETLGDRFRVERVLGRGNIGRVYQVTEQGTGKPFAVKTIYARFCNEPKAARNLLDLAKHMATVRHPNVASIQDTGRTAGLIYLVLPLLKGRTLEEALKVTIPKAQKSGIPVKQTTQIVDSVKGALGAVGDERPHLDLLPRNIFVSPQGLVVADAGLMHAVLPGLRPDDFQIMDGLEYMSPELRMGREVRASADVYSVGKILYHLVTLKKPPMDVTDIPIVGDYPPAMADLIRNAIAENPHQRYENVAMLAEGYHAVLAGQAAPTPRPQLHVVPSSQKAADDEDVQVFDEETRSLRSVSEDESAASGELDDVAAAAAALDDLSADIAAGPASTARAEVSPFDDDQLPAEDVDDSALDDLFPESDAEDLAELDLDEELPPIFEDEDIAPEDVDINFDDSDESLEDALRSALDSQPDEAEEETEPEPEPEPVIEDDEALEIVDSLDDVEGISHEAPEPGEGIEGEHVFGAGEMFAPEEDADELRESSLHELAGLDIGIDLDELSDEVEAAPAESAALAPEEESDDLVNLGLDATPSDEDSAFEASLGEAAAEVLDTGAEEEFAPVEDIDADEFAVDAPTGSGFDEDTVEDSAEEFDIADLAPDAAVAEDEESEPEAAASELEEPEEEDETAAALAELEAASQIDDMAALESVFDGVDSDAFDFEAAEAAVDEAVDEAAIEPSDLDELDSLLESAEIESAEAEEATEDEGQITRIENAAASLMEAVEPLGEDLAEELAEEEDMAAEAAAREATAAQGAMGMTGVIAETAPAGAQVAIPEPLSRSAYLPRRKKFPFAKVAMVAVLSAAIVAAALYFVPGSPLRPAGQPTVTELAPDTEPVPQTVTPPADMAGEGEGGAFVDEGEGETGAESDTGAKSDKVASKADKAATSKSSSGIKTPKSLDAAPTPFPSTAELRRKDDAYIPKPAGVTEPTPPSPPAAPVAKSALTAADINAVINRRIGRINYCFKEGLEENPSMSGRAEILFTIQPSGAVSSARVASSTLASPAAEECLRRRVMRMKFPAVSGPAKTVKFPFYYSK